MGIELEKIGRAFGEVLAAAMKEAAASAQQLGEVLQKAFSDDMPR
jgi:hypothetical protein